MRRQTLILGLAAYTGFSVLADNSTEIFGQPQQVYRTEVETSTLDNGGVYNKAALQQVQLITGVVQDPEVINVTDGVYNIVGVSAVNMTFIEGNRGIIVSLKAFDEAIGR